MRATLLLSATLIHLQGSQAALVTSGTCLKSATLIHLQGSQAEIEGKEGVYCLLPLFTYKVLKQLRKNDRDYMVCYPYSLTRFSSYSFSAAPFCAVCSPYSLTRFSSEQCREGLMLRVCSPYSLTRFSSSCGVIASNAPVCSPYSLTRFSSRWR